MNPFLKLVLELGPLVAFFITFTQTKHLGDLSGLMWATGVFMGAMAISLAVTRALTRKLSRMAVVTSIVVLVMGGLTLLLESDIFIKMKPTIVNALFCGALAFGLTRGESYLKYLMEEAIPLAEEGWMKLTRNWAIFFAAMAVLNEIVWRTQSTEFWVSFKTFGNWPITLIFTLSQIPLLTKYALEDLDAATDKAEASAPADAG